MDKLLAPHWAEIVKMTPEAEGVGTFHLKFIDPMVQDRYRFEPGQFNMLYVPGYGEAAISMSSDLETADGLLVHTIRYIGNVTKAISRLKRGMSLVFAAHLALPGQWKPSKGWMWSLPAVELVYRR